MATKIELTQMSDTMTEGTLLSWLKDEGDEVRQGDAVAEIETDKATMDLEAPADGVLLRKLVEPGATVPCGTVLAVIGAKGEPIPDIAPPSMAASSAAPTPPARPDERSTAQPRTDHPRLRSSPSARRLARIEGIDLGTVAGTGPDGRIVRRDIESAALERKRPAGARERVSQEVVPISRIRRKMIDRLVITHQTVPTFSLTRRIAMDGARAFRESLKVTATYARGIGYTELLVKAVARAMKAVPHLNARYTDHGIERLEEVNVGVAVGIDDGVVVPVIRRCQVLSLREIGEEFRRITAAAKEGSLLAADLGSSTFTVSNLGMYGVDEFSAILNAPDAAILAVGAIVPQPVASNGEIVIREMMAVTLTVDHRVADGVLAAQWLQAFVRCVENPVSLLVE